MPPQLDHADRQRHADEQHQPLRNHANHRRHRGRNGLGQRLPLKEKLLAEQQQPQRQQHRADKANQPVDLHHQHGFWAADFPCGGRQPRRVAVVAHIHQLCREFSFHNIAAGKQKVLRMLALRGAFAGEHRLVGRAHAADHQRIRHHLISGAQQHQIVLHQLLRFAGALLPVAQHMRHRGVEQRQAADGSACTQLLHRADQRVGHDHAQKQHIPEAAHQRQTNRQRRVERVKGREQVFGQNLPHRLVWPVMDHIRLALFCLPVGQAAGRGWGKVLRQGGRKAN